MKCKKTLFLDIDGVLNIGPFTHLNKQCMDNLKYIIEKTGCKIVISSSWRTGNLEKTKKIFPDWLSQHIIGETTLEGWKIKTTFPIVRGNEIKHWVDRNLVYPWQDNPEMDEEYKIVKDDGLYHGNRSNKQNVDFVYVVLDDDSDFLLEQKDNFIQCNAETGLTQEIAEKAIKILNRV